MSYLRIVRCWSGQKSRRRACWNKMLIFSQACYFSQKIFTLWKKSCLPLPMEQQKKIHPTLEFVAEIVANVDWNYAKRAELTGFLLTRLTVQLLWVLWKRLIQQQHKLSVIKSIQVSRQSALSQHLLKNQRQASTEYYGPESQNVNADPSDSTGSCTFNPPKFSLNTCSMKGLKGRSWVMRGSRATRKTRDISSWWTSKISGA